MRTFILFGIFLTAIHPSWSTELHQALITDDGKKLEGIVSVPDLMPLKGVALILPGSGTTGSDGDVSGPIVGLGYQGGSTKLSDQLALLLSQKGFATYRYNKRGYQDSDPASAVPLFSRLKQDAKEASDLVKKLYPQLPFYFVGLSEGALISIQLAAEVQANGIFLLSPPAGGIDDWLRYQAYEWPVQLIFQQVDLNRDGKLTAQEFSAAGVSKLPLLGKDLDLLHTESTFSFTDEVISLYQSYYANNFLALENIPPYTSWYSELTTLKDATFYLRSYTGKVWMYHGALDAQINPYSSFSLGASSAHVMKNRMFPNLGHCLSLHDGVIGEVKTAGPFHQDFAQAFQKDLEEALVQ